MRRGWSGAFTFAILLVGCAENGGRDGPALYPRPDLQTCLPGVPQEMPGLLSQTGCFTDLRTLEPAPELIPYEVNAPLWTDGAYKPRFLVVPKPLRITIEDDGSWTFPDGSILIKVFGFEFEVGDEESRRPVETRFMVKQLGSWQFYTYQWNAEGSDAELLSDGTTVEYSIADNGQQHIVNYQFPSKEDCTSCHGANARQVLGPKTSQMNRSHDYNGLIENQFVAMEEIGLFETETAIDPQTLAKMPDVVRGVSSTKDRARAYLDVNCAHCHRPGGFAMSSVDIDLRYETPFADMRLCDEPMRFFQWAGIPRIVPGDSQGSGLFQRFIITTSLRMPSLGTSVIDSGGAELLADWIDSLRECPVN